MISLPTFVRAVSAYSEGKVVTADTWLWSDLRVFGDDWDDFIVNTLDALGVDAESDLDVYNYIPLADEVGLFGKIIARRTIPDLRLRELFAYLEFKARH